ncbi:DUF3244 domain-containing protein [Parabacteroides sp. GYB001]|uniref:DUF3244 domain-containing protein n=1 Tax=Parabacteroides leei TaxID=2939491 RepID=UPI002017D65B|nr:DUF3244 domain-containing protein [Parabacteroides leei]MCL3852718.1 DUF3244 domain-containing protein [Parabacteroides leei]
MNQTKTLFGTLIVAGFFFMPCVQTNVFASGNKELCTVASSSKVYLKGRLSTPTTRSSSQSIEVFQEDNALMVYYLNALGKIEITISNNQDSIVYSDVISVFKDSKSLIELSGLSNGSHIIKFKDSEGGELTGIFTVE